MNVIDWRGNTYTEGSRIFYPRASGRAMEICEARVLKINTRANGRVRSVQVLPCGKGSRAFHRVDYTYRKNDAGVWKAVETGVKPVTLTIIKNITAA